MQLLLLNNAEDTHWRRMVGHAGRNRRLREQTLGIVKSQLLLGDGDGNDQGAVRLGGLFFDNDLRFRTTASMRFQWWCGRRGLGNSGGGILPIIDRSSSILGDAERPH